MKKFKNVFFYFSLDVVHLFEVQLFIVSEKVSVCCLENFGCVLILLICLFVCFFQDLGISKVGHMKRILQGTKELAKASMVDL